MLCVANIMKRTKNERKGNKLKKLREDDNTHYYLSVGKWAEVDSDKVSFIGCGTLKPKYYKEYYFCCKDCGVNQVWTAQQQKWWYEEAGGKLETRAVRCRACRLKEKMRISQARATHLTGLSQKRQK